MRVTVQILTDSYGWAYPVMAACDGGQRLDRVTGLAIWAVGHIDGDLAGIGRGHHVDLGSDLLIAEPRVLTGFSRRVAAMVSGVT